MIQKLISLSMNLLFRLLKLKDIVKYFIYLNNILELNYIRADSGE